MNKVGTHDSRRMQTQTSEAHHIFLIEDHPLMRRALRELLETEPDVTVSWEAESVEAALAQLPELTPDLVLTDLSLPGASGLELVQTLKHTRPELRCLVVTGYDGNLHRNSALRVGAAGFVTKDNPTEVLLAVRRILDLRSA